MKLSARNILKGIIKQVTPGAVDTEVIIEIAPGVEIASIITKSSAENLGLKVGNPAYAIIKAPNVIIGVD
jgi:molybdopterin-binding protein